MSDASEPVVDELYQAIAAAVAAEPGFLLLSVLDEAIRNSPDLPPVQGVVCLGVCGVDREQWLTVESEPASVSTRMSAVPPPMADAALLLGEVDARAILESGRAPESPALASFTGDRRLFDELLDRYLVQVSLLELRARQARGDT